MAEFDIQALESGDASLGPTGMGSGEEDWRLELTTELDIEARAYARSEELIEALHHAALVSGEEVELTLFPPAADGGSRIGIVRAVNRSSMPAEVSPQCVTAAVTEGANTMKVVALNGTGGPPGRMRSDSDDHGR